MQKQVSPATAIVVVLIVVIIVVAVGYTLFLRKKSQSDEGTPDEAEMRQMMQVEGGQMPPELPPEAAQEAPAPPAAPPGG